MNGKRKPEGRNLKKEKGTEKPGATGGDGYGSSVAIRSLDERSRDALSGLAVVGTRPEFKERGGGEANEKYREKERRRKKQDGRRRRLREGPTNPVPSNLAIWVKQAEKGLASVRVRLSVLRVRGGNVSKIRSEA